MRVCFFGTYEEDYPRNQILIKAMKRAGIEVIECHVDFWRKQIHKTKQFRSSFSLLFFACRIVVAYAVLMFQYIFSPEHDAVLVGYPGHLDIFAINWLARFKRVPLVFDAWVSLYDTIVKDRKLIPESSFLAKFIFHIDRKSCKLADHVILDTNAQIDFFANTFHLPQDHFRRIFASADDEIFAKSENESAGRDIYRVLFIGKFTPLHGIPVIVEAAKLLEQEKNIHFDIIGTGQLFSSIESDIKQRNLANIQLHRWINYNELPRRIQQANVCLGIFSASSKANRVIPNKIFQALSCGKPVITARTNAAQELLKDMEHAYFVSPENAAELAQAIRTLKNDENLARHLATAGHRRFHSEADLNATATQLNELFSELIKRS